MVWTYDPAMLADPVEGPRNQVRFLIQDTNSSRKLVDDQEIDWLLTQEANVYMAAAAACDSLVAKGGMIKSKSVNDLAITYDVLFYQTLAGNLRGRGASGQVPFMGGVSVSDKAAQQADPDAVQPRVFRGFADNSGASNPTPSSADSADPLRRTP